MVVYGHNPRKLRQRNQKFRANLGSLTRRSLINKGHAHPRGYSSLICTVALLQMKQSRFLRGEWEEEQEQEEEQNEEEEH